MKTAVKTWSQKKDDAITKIAQEVLQIKTLSVQNSDSLDFHEIHVVALEVALKRAYYEGYQSCLCVSV